MNRDLIFNKLKKDGWNDIKSNYVYHGIDIACDIANEIIKEKDNKIFGLKRQTNNYILFIKHKGCDYRQSEIDDTFYKIKENLEDYVLIKKEHKELAIDISYNSSIKFEWWHYRAGGYWQTGRDFFESYDDDLDYRIKQ